MSSDTPKICLTQGCSRKHHARGSCKPHYLILWAGVALGETTWDELEKAGKATHVTVGWSRQKPQRVRCRGCEVDYDSIRKASTGCGFPHTTVTKAIHGDIKMPSGHDWLFLGEND